jgi:hypothetical protein
MPKMLSILSVSVQDGVLSHRSAPPVRGENALGWAARFRHGGKADILPKYQFIIQHIAVNCNATHRIRTRGIKFEQSRKSARAQSARSLVSPRQMRYTLW